MNYHFNWSVLWSGQTGAWLLHGVVMTLEISLVGWFIAAALGILSGALRTLPILPLRWLAAGYVEFFRNGPARLDVFFVLRRAAVLAAGAARLASRLRLLILGGRLPSLR